ncbi:NAD-dependent epimerase/dehydratase family protein [Taibaiella chishuiensis]|uniref:NAD-dependent epimerase/dehydratase family protein n=1 Tax=Taibaiella chishuiensis TaxID=1434707 RepID=UPI000D0D0E49|nr:NAD-dependent epimerase/dehydratase family protein [Taibaiella chishuiensis]
MILVTGASGFLGQHLLQALAGQPLPVIALYNSRRPEGPASPGLTWKQCDLLDIFSVAAAMEGITQVYHCAAIVSFDPRKKEDMIQANVEGTANLVNAALEAGVEKLVHVSSIAALGRTAEALAAGINEDTHWEESKDNSAYAESKFRSEMEVWRAMAEGLNAAIVNPAIILGEGDWDSGSANLMQIVYKEFPWYTDGVNAWVDVKDVVAAMIAIMSSDISDERYIISAGNFAYKEVFTAMAHALNRKPPYKHASPWMTEIVWRMEVLKSRIAKRQVTISKESARTAQTRCYYSNEKLLRDFPGFTYHTLQDTVSRMAAAFLRDRQA